MSGLAERECIPCKGGVPPLAGAELTGLLSELSDGWQVAEEHHLEREYAFPDFAQALAFTNGIGEMAESQNHHPDIFLTWGRVGIAIWTHTIDGLTESDFVFAAKCDRIYGSR